MKVKKSNILILTYWSYKDALIQTYTLPYVKIIRNIIPNSARIILFTYEFRYFKMSRKEWTEALKCNLNNGIEIKKSTYRNFGVLAIFLNLMTLLRLWFLIVFNNIKTIHVFGSPAGAIAWFLKISTGVKLIIDSYEPHAENMVENGEWNSNSLAFRMLFRLEKKQSRSASAVIATTSGMRDYAKEKYQVTFKKFYVKPSCVDLDLFNPDKFNKAEERKKWNIKDDSIVGVYIGKFGGIYLEDEFFGLIKASQVFWKEKGIIFICTNRETEWINKKISEFAINEKQIIVIPYVPHERIPAILSIADYGINPVKPLPTKRFCTSIKDGEYWAMGLPVIITPDISDDSFIIKEQNIGSVLAGFDEEDYKNSIIEIDTILKNNDDMKYKIRKCAEKYRNINIAQIIYNDLYSEKL